MARELGAVGNPQFASISSTRLFDPDECDRIIASVDDGPWAPALVSDYDDPGSVRANVRSVLSQPLATDELGWPLTALIERISATNEDVFRFEIDGFIPKDAPSVLRYEAATLDEFKPHRDAGVFSPTRKLSCVVQLSDPADYVGGDLVFNHEGTIADKERGQLTLFPSFIHHQVTPVISGIRHVLVAWVHGPTFR